ncbi:MAG: Ig-like domain-containing protein [Gemmatimonadota bacterium]|nr:Ig-like domain-containing protein [Gemmatimonadota bacterium]
MPRFTSLLALTLLIATAPPLAAQDFTPSELRIEVSDERLSVEAGERVTFTARVVDGQGAPVDVPLRIVGARTGIEVGDGFVAGVAPGEHEIFLTAVLPAGAAGDPPQRTVPVSVQWPAVTDIEIEAPEATLFVGTTLPHEAEAYHADGSPRPDAPVQWRTSDSSVIAVDAFGNVTGVGPGTATVTAELERGEASLRHTVESFPGASLTLEGGVDEARTGDVIRFQAVLRDEDGTVLDDVPVSWSHSYTPTEGMLGVPATGQIRDGAYVADVPGIHTVVASAGPLSDRHSFEAVERDVVQEIEVTGHALESWYRTTDLWVFEGVDGRDYAITGSKVSGGYAFFYDVTDPGAIEKIDSIQVDARTVNDVKASPDGRYAALSREGATNRRDGLVLVDLADPRNPSIASIYDDGITGGVHNVFAEDDYLYALSNGDKYVIIDVTDIHEPRFVSEYNHPNSRLHDVWVHDGLAYSSEWETGVVVVDVGDGRWGGSPENPVFVTSYPTPSGATHAAFPYFQESTGKTYLFLGDEIMQRRGLAWAGYPSSMGSYSQQYDPETGTGGIPLVTRGYIQIVDFTDPENPEMVARYQVPEFGTHNMWVEDDKLYQAYYEGGLRVVDVSGELMGNLYTQGREIAVFKSASPAGYTPNATMVWGTMPHKGHVFFSDTNSGLWSVRLLPKTKPIS